MRMSLSMRTSRGERSSCHYNCSRKEQHFEIEEVGGPGDEFKRKATATALRNAARLPGEQCLALIAAIARCGDDKKAHRE